MSNNILTLNSSNKKILVIDDDPSVLRCLSIVLQEYASITAVSSGKQAIDLLLFQSFDVIITDYEMKDGSGIDVLKFVNDKKISSPIIMITAYGDKDLVIKALNFKVFGFIEKPLNSSLVDKQVKMALIKKESDDELIKLSKIGNNAITFFEEIDVPIKEFELKIAEIDKIIENHSEEEIETKLETIQASSDRIKHLIEQTKKKINVKPAQLHIEEFNLKDLLEDLKMSCIDNLIKYEIILLVSKNINKQIRGDKELILQSLISLIKNSISSVSNIDERWISLDSKLIGKNLQIIVTDSRKSPIYSFTKRLLNSLFSNDKELPSLSLNFVKNVIIGHGGQVQFSQNLKNTQFIISIPTT